MFARCGTMLKVIEVMSACQLPLEPDNYSYMMQNMYIMRLVSSGHFTLTCAGGVQQMDSTHEAHDAKVCDSSAISRIPTSLCIIHG